MKNSLENFILDVKPDETREDIIAELCEAFKIDRDTPFAFSAIMYRTEQKEQEQIKIKVNYVPQITEDINYINIEYNRYSPATLVEILYLSLANNLVKKGNIIAYARPSLEDYITVFTPMLQDIITRAHPFYKRLIPNRDDLVSTMYFVVCKLYRKGYYVNKNLVYMSFINELNIEVRKLKNLQHEQSLSQVISDEDGGTPILLQDIIVDDEQLALVEELTRYTIKDYWEDMFEQIKAAMLKNMSQLSFDRIILQIEHKCIDTQTAHLLYKLRKKYNAGNLRDRTNNHKNQEE